MVPASLAMPQRRSGHRIAVRLPVIVRGSDRRGVIFEEETSSLNICRDGAALVTRLDVAVGSDVGMRIPFSRHPCRRAETDFVTSGKVVHVGGVEPAGERLVGVQFTGPRFQRMFQSESAA